MTLLTLLSGEAAGRKFFGCKKMPRKARDEPAIVVGRAYDFSLWLLPKVEKFPRSYRFSVGDRLVATTLDLLLLLVVASYPAKKAHLVQQPVANPRFCPTVPPAEVRIEPNSSALSCVLHAV